MNAQAFKLATELTLIVLMTGLNFRGMRESIMVLLPIFLGFVVLHLGLVIYGVAAHGDHLAAVVPGAVGEARGMSHALGPLVVAVLVTSAVLALCFLIKRHYSSTRVQLAKEDALFAGTPPEAGNVPVADKPDPSLPTAILLVGKHRGASMHALLWVNRLFPDHFKNMIFLAVGEVDAQSYEGTEHLERLRQTISSSLDYYVAHCRRHGIAAEYRIAFGTHPVGEFMKLADSTMDDYPNSVCFASKLIFKQVNFLTAWLHNQTPVEIQTRLHLQGRQMVRLPMNVG